MRRIGQVEAKTYGIWVDSFKGAKNFHKVEWKLDVLAKNDGRECVYNVIPFDKGRTVMIHVYLMPKGYKFADKQSQTTEKS
jgi:hypothetical protein